MHESIKEQEKAAKAGLEYLQVQANKDALEAECKGQSDEIAVAQAHFVESMCIIMSRVPSGVVVSWCLTQSSLDAVHQRFAEVKEDSREKLRISREKLEECDDEIRGQFQQMEEVSRRRCRAGRSQCRLLMLMLILIAHCTRRGPYRALTELLTRI